MERSPEIRTVSATEAKNRFGEILKGAYQRGEHTVIERDGIPVAVFVPIQDYLAAQTPRTLAESRGAYAADSVAEADTRDRLAAFLDRLSKVRPDVPEDEVLREIEEAKARVELRDFMKKTHKDLPRYPEAEIEEDIRVAIEAVRGL